MAYTPRPFSSAAVSPQIGGLSPRRLLRRAGRAHLTTGPGTSGGAEQLESRLLLAVFDPGGSAIGSLTPATLGLNAVDQVIIDINPSASGAKNDSIVVAGSSTLNGLLNLRIANAGALAAGQTYSLLTSGAGSLSGAFLSIKNIDASSAGLNFVALQTSSELRLVVTDLPTPDATIVIDSTLTPSQQAAKLAELTGWFAAGASNAAATTASTAGSLRAYGQKFVGSLTFSTDENVGTRFADIAIGDLNGNPARLVVSAGVVGLPTVGISAYGSTTLRVNPRPDGTSRLTVNAFTAAGFALGDQAAPDSLAGSQGNIGPVSFTGFTLGLSNIELSSTSFAGTVTITAATAGLALGGSSAANDSSRFKIEATDLSVSVTLNLSVSGTTIVENPGSGAFSITAEEVTMEIKDIVTVKASGGIAINKYDSSLPASQTLVSIGTAIVEVPKLGLRGSFTPSAPGVAGVVIRGDGFSFGTLSVGLTDDIAGAGPTAGPFTIAGGRLRVSSPAVTVTDFSMSFSPTGAITQTRLGSFGVSVGSIQLTPLSGPSAARFNASATDLSITVKFPDGVTVTPGQPVVGSPSGLLITLGTLDITLGFVKLQASDIEIDTAAGPSERFITVAGSITATLDLTDFFSTSTSAGPNIQITGSAGGFAINGDGSFLPFTTSSPAPYNDNPFNVRLVVQAGQIADVLDGVANLPDSLPRGAGVSGTLDLRVTWPDFSAAPERFLMRISGDIQGTVGGSSGLTLAFRVEDLRIDSGKLANGEFPVVGFTSISGSVSGTIMGASFNGAIVIGLVRFDSVGGVLDPDADLADIAATRLYVGARGGLTLPNGWGVNVQFAFSEKGFLNFYLSTNLDIPLGTSGLSLTGLRGGVTFNATPLPNIDDPVDLRNSAFESPGDLTDEEWEAQVQQLVINQFGGTPGFIFEIDQPAGQDWVGLFDDNADPGLYLPEPIRTQFLGAGIAVPRKAGVSSVETLEASVQWLLRSGDDAYIIDFDSNTSVFSFSQITFVLPFELAADLPTGTDTATAGSVLATIDGQSLTLVELFAQSGRVISAGAIVEPGADAGEWSITDGQVFYTLTVRGEAGSEIIAVTGGDPTFESGSGMTVRLDAGFSLSSTGGSSAWRLDADAVIQFTVGGPSATKIILLGDLSVGPAANPTLSIDTRLLIDLSQAGSVTILMLADFRLAPPSASAADPNPAAPIPFFSVYGRVVFTFASGEFSFSLSGSQTRGVAVFDTAGLVDSPLGSQKLLLGAPSSPSAMNGAGRASVTFSNNKLRFNFAATISAQGIIDATNAVSASGDFTVEFSNVSVGSLGSIKLPTALYGAARLNASLDQIEILTSAGITGNINLLLKVNTTNTAQTALLFDPVGMVDEPISIARRSFAIFGDGNLSFKPPVVGSLFSMQITGAFGIDISADSGANLFIVGTMPVPIPGAALAGLTADVVGLLRIDGSNFAARLELGIRNNASEIKFFSIGAALQLYINTAGTEASYTMPRDIATRLGTTLPATLASRLVWSGAGDASIVVPARAPLISYSTDGATSSTPGGYLVIQGFGNLDILDPISRTRFLGVSAAARLALQVDASNPGAIKTQFLFEVTGSASLGGLIDINLNAGVIIATTFDATGPLPRLTSVNMAGLLQLSASASLANVITLSGSGSVRINTFATPQTVAGVTLEANAVSITVTGELNVGGIFKLNGTFTFVNNAQRVAISGNVELDLYVARVAVDLSAAIYKSVIVNGVETNSPGLVINVGINLNVDFLKVFVISGSGRLKLSTRAVDTVVDTAPVGQRLVPARIDASTPFVNINLAAALNFLDLVTVNGTLDFTTINDTAFQPGWSPSVKRHWRISGSLSAAAGISFLGGAEARIGNARQLDGNLSGRQAVFYDTGEFDIDASLRVQVGPDEFNVNGRAYAFASYLRNSSGVKILSFGGGAALGISVDVDLGETDFGLFTVDWGSITFSFDAVSVSFSYNGNTGEVSIRPCVIGICKTFTLGFFKLPPGAGVVQRPVVINLAGPLAYTARPASDGPAGVFDETVAWAGGALYINAGDRAAFRNISGSIVDEDFIVEPDGPFNATTGRQNLKVTAFGQTQTRSDVSSIQALMGSGIDTVTVRAGVLVPITIDGGAGNDKITYSAAGVATIRGGADNDRITAAGASGSSIDGGDGNDVITWLSGNGAAVSVTGGAGIDQFIATFTDLPDRIRLGRTAPEQFRVSKLDAAGAALEFVSVTGGIETLRINARRGADELIVDDFDAAGMTAFLDISRYQSGSRAVTTSDGGTGQAPIYSNDTDADSIIISGRAVDETFTLTSPADTGDQDGDSDTAEGIFGVARSIGGASVYTLTILNAVPATGELLRVSGLQGADTLDAAAVDKDILRLTLIGNAGNDTLRGSPFADTLVGDEQNGSGTGNDLIFGNAGNDSIIAGGGNDVINAGDGDDAIDSGLGDDTVTGGAGSDTFTDAGGSDTLIETRDRDVFIASNRFVVGTLSAGSLAGFADAFSSVDENENLAGIFDIATLTGGSSANTFVVGDVNGTLSLPGNPAFATGQQWVGTITLDGLGGGDRYIITVFGVSNSTINVSDTGSAGTDLLRIYGSDLPGRTDSFLVRRNFVAALFDNDNNGSLETFDRVNYSAAIEGGLTIDALAGDDRLVVDQTSIATTLRGGTGRDLFQFGQIFGSERIAPAVAIGDEIPSVAILLGTPTGGTVTARLTPGPSNSLTAFGGEGDDSFVVYRTVSPLNLRGETGDDAFSVRAFEQVGGGGTTQGNTTVAGGPGFNLIEFVANAPIDIDGGEGTDTVRMLGTFRDDQYIVDADGITGPGASITFTNIEILEINSGDGNDEIFVRSTAANLRLVVYGGAGSDRIYVGAPVPGSASNPAFTNTLQGINGPVLIDGGPGAGSAFGLAVSLRLPSETDTSLPPGAGGMMTEEQADDVDIIDIVSTAEDRALAGLMSARVWPTGNTSLNIVTLSGLGMAGDLIQNGATVPGGISMRRLEVVDTRMGSGVETVTISAVVAGATTVFRGNAGSDVFNVSAADPGDARLVIYTDAAPGETLAGAPGNDRVDARSASVPMVLDGGAGNDVLLAGSGDDAIAGGSGDDVISGGAGDDVIFGDSRLSTDRLTRLSTIFTQGLADSDLAGSDIINPGSGYNIAFGDHGLVGQNGSPAGSFGPGGFFTSAVTVRPAIGAADIISAFAAASPEFAGLPASADGSDLVFGGAGRDTLNTGDGKDWIVGDHASAMILASSSPVTGPGPSAKPQPGGVVIGINGRLVRTPVRAVSTDFAGAVRPSATTILSQQLLADRAVFITSTDPTSGDNDTINAGSGDDVAIGGTGADIIDTGAGDDYAFGDHARFDPAGPIAQRFVSLFTTITGAGDADRILGGDGSDVLMGQQGADVIFAGSGNDDVIGGHNVSGGFDAGDFIDAGSGDDVVVADNGSVVRDPAARSPRFAAPTAGSIYAADLEVALRTAGIPTGAGAAQVRTIVQLDAGPSAPAGTSGADRVAGGAGRDLILAGNGDDSVRGDSRLVEASNTLPALARSLDATTDADDYIEGNAGNDTIYGDLGQDDLVGGSSSFFGLAAGARADGSDTIFGGDGTATGINNPGDTSATGAARDADTIAGDNADVSRIVDALTGAVRTFNHDAGASLRLVPRAVRLLDYTADSLSTGDTGAADTINAEAGNDTVYGMTGNDLIYGDGQNDDLIGGSGDDWIFGGTGADAVLGDDGRLLTSRNGAAEPLFGIAATSPQVAITTDTLFTVPVYVSGTLLRTARLQGGASGGADVIFGGLGDDSIHAGGGNDAVSGAEALPTFYTPPAVRPTLVFNPSMRRFTVFQAGFPLQKLQNFFLNFNSGPLGTPTDDGKDALFGNQGHDWLVGGTSSDFLFGGLGDDVLNADDNLDTTFNGANNIADIGADAAPDIVFGGGGLDRMIANAANDRLIDWYLDFNQYSAPFLLAAPTITKNFTPTLISALTTLGSGLGMDTRLLEPDGELGIITSTDAQWIDQIGRPFNP